MLLFEIYSFILILLQWNKILVLHNHINNEVFKLVSSRLLGQSNGESYDETNLKKTFVLHTNEKDSKLGSPNICVEPEPIADLRIYKSKGSKDARNKLKNDKPSTSQNNNVLKYKIKKDPLNDKNDDDKILGKKKVNHQNFNNSKSNNLNSNKQYQTIHNEEVKLFDKEAKDVTEPLNDLLDGKFKNVKLLIEEILKKEFQQIKKRLDTLLKNDMEKCELIKNKILENQIEKANILRDKLLEDKTICEKLKIEEINSIESLENSINNMGIRDRTKLQIKKHIQNYMDVDDSFDQVIIYNQIKKCIKNDIKPGIFRKIVHTLKIEEGLDVIGKSKYYHKIKNSPLLLYIRRYVIFDVIVFVGTSQLLSAAPTSIPIIVALLVVLFLIVKYGGNIKEFFQKLTKKKKKKKRVNPKH
ncbi:Plasmodium exported protein, unknown function [Plasmodium vinckei vinckei]|uniref:Uncharacterized protein n=1 Tax=Plasmodium vinckei vinckei TaxID=54757 RepID=A0A449BUJ1_PLAVN|nr:Plasmodium exported protein, unknown function [Plasmodium vinckei vinckei]VEV57140.1 Plasmodium exported protein, unknown function [Plasmodium vinckei vinckei]